MSSHHKHTHTDTHTQTYTDIHRHTQTHNYTNAQMHKCTNAQSDFSYTKRASVAEADKSQHDRPGLPCRPEAGDSGRQGRRFRQEVRVRQRQPPLATHCPLLLAVKNGHLTLVQWLLKAGGASVAERNNRGTATLLSLLSARDTCLWYSGCFGWATRG
jgi:hypothetical protein